jgi:hypothetical protein
MVAGVWARGVINGPEELVVFAPNANRAAGASCDFTGRQTAPTNRHAVSPYRLVTPGKETNAAG